MQAAASTAKISPTIIAYWSVRKQELRVHAYQINILILHNKNIVQIKLDKYLNKYIMSVLFVAL